MPPPTPAARLASLDQFRGYTVLGMVVVNFVGSFAAVRAAAPLLCHHHTYCSYADTIMPQFLFAVGFAFRLSFLKRAGAGHAGAAYWHAVKRSAGLLLVAFAVYGVGARWEKWSNTDQLLEVLARWAKRDLMQTLGQIAVTSLWVLPVVTAGWKTRAAYAVYSGALHLVLSYWFNYRWVNSSPMGIDGGPLGFLTWTIPLLVGTIAYDLYAIAGRPTRYAARLAALGVILAAAAYGLSGLHLAPSDLDQGQYRVTAAPAPPPLVHLDLKPPTNDLFTMSQRSGSLSYTLFGAGCSLVVLAVFVLVCDAGSFQLGIFRTFGTNALAAYVIHGLVNNAVEAFVPRDAPLWFVAVGTAAAVLVTYMFVRYLENHKLFLRL